MYSCVGLSGKLRSSGLWAGVLGGQWWFERCKSTWAWQWWSWVVDIRFSGIHDNSRHHGTLIPSVVFGQCSWLLRVVTWQKKKKRKVKSQLKYHSTIFFLHYKKTFRVYACERSCVWTFAQLQGSRLQDRSLLLWTVQSNIITL